MFRFIPVTCVIMQKNGAGLHTASSCFWDNSTDGNFPIIVNLTKFINLFPCAFYYFDYYFEIFFINYK